MPDGDSDLFTVTDLKQYLYCPRILYYQTCLPDIRPTTYKMQAGVEAHEKERKRAARRSLKMYGLTDGRQRFEVPVQSASLSLIGLVDEVIDTGTEIIPVDYKLSRLAGYHYKVQLTAYAMMLEEETGQPVRRGFLYLIPRKKAQEVRITGKLRATVREAMNTLHCITTREYMPPPTRWRQRCPDCEFRRFCNDV